jgi:hypothetical protein
LGTGGGFLDLRDLLRAGAADWLNLPAGRAAAVDWIPGGVSHSL